MKRLQFSLARMIVCVALAAVACGAVRFTWGFAGWLLMPSAAVVLLAAWATVMTWGRGRTVLLGFTLGAAAGWVLDMFAIVLAGVGHGTYIPLRVFFMPVYLPIVMVSRDWLNVALFAAAPLLYALYGAAIARSVQKQTGRGLFIAILLFHYGCLAFSVVVETGDDPARFLRAFDYLPEWMVAAAVFFVGIQLAAAVLFIERRKPSRDLGPFL